MGSTIVGLSVVVGLAACSGPPSDADGARSTTTTSTATATAPADAVADAVPGGQLVHHAEGDTLVAEQPTRVVVLDSPQLDAALSVGITPVGAVRSMTSATLPMYLGETDGIEIVGSIEDPRLDLDAIRALRPDLILSSTTRHGRSYDDLAAIAPTVFAETVGANWRANYLLFTTAMGRRAEADRQLEAYDARIAQLRPQLAAGGIETAAVVRFMPEEVRLYSTRSFPGEVLTDLGLRFPAATDDEIEISTPLRPDQVGVIDSQVVFHMTYGPRSVTDRDAVLSGPAWAGLPAVQRGLAFEVDDDSWMQGVGVLGASALLDAVADHLAVGDLVADDRVEAP